MVARWDHGYALLLGGARSGKSALAGELALGSGRPVVVVATAQAGDADMARRIAAHRAERPDGWHTVEEPIELGTTVVAAPPGTLVVVDCLTLWVSNLLLGGESVD